MAKAAERPAVRAGTKFVAGVFERLGLAGVRVTGGTETDDTVVVKLGGDVSALQRNRELIGAVALLAGQVVSRVTGERLRCLIDVGGELDERKDLLEGLAAEVAEVVARTGRRVVVESLSPGERRLVHTALLDDPRVSTRSEGDEDHRMLFIEPAA